MKAVCIDAARMGRVFEQPNPKSASNYVVVRILAAPMCTEVSSWINGTPTTSLGHEAAGEIVEVPQNSRLRVGDRVVVMPQNGCGTCDLCLAGEHIRCQSQRDLQREMGSNTGRSTFAQYCMQQDWLLFPVPDDIPILHASMACCGLGPTFNATRQMQLTAGDVLLISGLGAVGLGGVINGVLQGARVIGLESNSWRANLALKLGAEAVINPSSPDALSQLMALTDGKGADKSIEASSADTAPAFLVTATRVNGQLTTVGWGGAINARDVLRRGVTVRGAWHWNHLRDAAAMRSTLRRAASLLNLYITHTFPLTKVQDAWAVQESGRCGKVVLLPWDQS